jgi:drug/metabolite transporter (DMT)-like permease
VSYPPAVWMALAAAALFGGSTPLIKLLVGDASPLALAGLLYLGSGLGLAGTRLLRDRTWRASGLVPTDWRWLAGAIGFGGIVGPVLLVWGLTRTAAGTASLLLNLEAVLTSLLAWVVFREHVDRRIMFGMGLIVAGGVALSWPTAASADDAGLGLLAILGACLCWAIDNNLTRKVSAGDVMFTASAKGLVAGATNFGLSLALGEQLPGWSHAGAAMLVGWLGYGVSLAFFVHALRGLGAARTGAYFSTAPFVGAAVSIVLLGEAAPPAFWIAAVLMGGGVWLHLTERHDHPHVHEALGHAHAHVHDSHHRHAHDFSWDGREPHDHTHRHTPLHHGHPHFPDIHHRHPH